MSGSVLEKPVSLVPQDRDGGGRMLRIALVTETWYPSVDGIVTRLTCTVRELHRRGHAVMVVAPSSRTQAIGSIDRLPGGPDGERGLQRRPRPLPSITSKPSGSGTSTSGKGA